MRSAAAALSAKAPERRPRAGAAAVVACGVIAAHVGLGWSLAGEPPRRLAASPVPASVIELVSRTHAAPNESAAGVRQPEANASLRRPSPLDAVQRSLAAATPVRASPRPAEASPLSSRPSRPSRTIAPVKAAVIAPTPSLRPVALHARSGGGGSGSVAAAPSRLPAWEAGSGDEAAPSDARSGAAALEVGERASALLPDAETAIAAAGATTSAMTTPAASMPAPAPGSLDADLPPVYPTAPPSSMSLRYEMSRGFLTGEAALRWQSDGRKYDATFDGAVLGVSLIGWHSSGGFDRAGLAPERFLEERRGRAAQAANFRRDKGVIGFSGPSIEIPLVAGAQDRLSWMIQLAAVAKARKTPFAVGDRVEFFVSGARGDGDVWSFSVEGRERISLPVGEVDAIRLLREPRKPHDTRVDAWIDPSRQFMPVRARLAQEGKDDALDLRLKSASVP